MKKIDISVIIPTYKRNDYLPRAIESVLNQKCNYELIVVDDNDSNSEYRKNNIELMKKYKKVIYLKHDVNKNGAAARNTGLSVASGKYVTFLDDDDEFVSDRLEKVMKVINKTEPDFICTGYIYKYKNKSILNNVPDIDSNRKKCEFNLLKAKSFFGTGSNMICKRELVNKIGGFDSSFLRNQDIEFMIRYLEVAKSVFVIPDCLVIKNIDNIINVPSYEKALENKKKFLKKFDYIINSYDESTKKQIYQSHYYELLYNAIKKNDKSEIRKARLLLKNNNMYSMKKEIIMKIKRRIKTSFLYRLVKHT